MTLYKTVFVFLDSIALDDTSEYELDLNYYEDKAYDKLTTIDVSLEELIDKNYSVTKTINRTFCPRFNEYVFEGEIRFYL